MDRRKFVSALGLGAATAALTACGKQDCETGAAAGADKTVYKWKMVTTWPQNYPGLGTSPEKFAKLVKKMSGGRIDIKVFGAGTMVPALEVFDAVSQGSAELGHGAAYYWKGKQPAAPFFTAVPFGFTAQEQNGWLNHGGGQQLWDELYARFNLKPFACGNTGTQLPGWYNKEINSIKDLAGLKIRMPGLAGEVLQRLGASTVNLPGGEIFTSLESGVIDAADWVGPYNDLTFGFHKIAKFYYYPGWHEPGPTLELIINKEVWDGLPEDLQAIITAATAWANDDMLSEYTARNSAALKELREKHGVQVRRLPDDVLVALKEQSDVVLDELTANDELARRVYDSYRSFATSAQSMSSIGETEYLRVRETLAR